MKTRKELKREYKESKPTSGVFQIRNKINGKIYITGGIDLRALFNRHKMQLDSGTHKSSRLNDEWKKFGEENFIFEILEELKPSDEPGADMKRDLKQLEDMLIEEKQPFDEKGYNIRKRL